MWNFLKTTALLGVMTGFMLLMGAVIGGAGTQHWAGALGGMFLMLIVAAVMNFGTWFFADTLVIKTMRAKPIPEGELSWLRRDLEEVADKAGIPTPRLYIVPHQQSPNAFATGRSPRKGVVAVTAGLLRVLDRREVKGVVAHEVGHIKNRDTLVSAIAATLAGAITFLAYSARFVMGRRGMNPIVGLLILILAPLAAVVLRMMISRTREYGADRRAAQLTGDPEGLASALERLGGGVKSAPMQGDAARNVHCIVNGFTGGLGRLMSTHPPIHKRAARLRESADR